MIIRMTAVGIVLATGTAAQAAFTELNFGYESVNASYDGATTLSFTGKPWTTGDVFVTRTPTKNAQFMVGAANIDGSLNLSNITTSTADGVGALTLTDIDGSTISCSITGTFLKSGIVFFEGILGDVAYNFADNEFNGSNASKFTTSDFDTAATIGDLVLFEFQSKWFTDGAFSTDVLQLDGSTRVPEPRTALLLILCLAAWRIGAACHK